jgi:hypothetical protein
MRIVKVKENLVLSGVERQAGWRQVQHPGMKKESKRLLL